MISNDFQSAAPHRLQCRLQWDFSAFLQPSLFNMKYIILNVIVFNLIQSVFVFVLNGFKVVCLIWCFLSRFVFVSNLKLDLPLPSFTNDISWPRNEYLVPWEVREATEELSKKRYQLLGLWWESGVVNLSNPGFNGCRKMNSHWWWFLDVLWASLSMSPQNCVALVAEAENSSRMSLIHKPVSLA